LAGTCFSAVTRGRRWKQRVLRQAAEEDPFREAEAAEDHPSSQGEVEAAEDHHSSRGEVEAAAGLLRGGEAAAAGLPPGEEEAAVAGHPSQEGVEAAAGLLREEAEAAAGLLREEAEVEVEGVLLRLEEAGVGVGRRLPSQHLVQQGAEEASLHQGQQLSRCSQWEPPNA
jgi:hypothetical protein